MKEPSHKNVPQNQKVGNDFLPSLVPIIVIYYSLLFTRRQRNWAVARGTVPVIDFNTLSLPLLRTAEVLSPPSARIDALLLGDRPPPVVCYYKICVVETKLKLSISSTTLASAVCGSWASPGPWNVWVPAGSLRYSTSVCSPGKLSQPPLGGGPPPQLAVQSSRCRGSSCAPWALDGAPPSNGGLCCCTLSTGPGSREEELSCSVCLNGYVPFIEKLCQIPV